jgi:hypothetical protein
MSLEHFAQGAGESRHVIKLLSHVEPVVSGDPQGKKVQAAENTFRIQQYQDNKQGGLGVKSSKDLLGEIVHHSAMDEVPGIEELRRTFDPTRDATVAGTLIGLGRNGEAPRNLGGGVIDKADRPDGRNHVVFSLEPKLDNLVPRSVITHEASHLALLNAQQLGHFPAQISHSWPMARLHLHLVHQMFGKPAANHLKYHYEKMGVNFGH